MVCVVLSNMGAENSTWASYKSHLSDPSIIFLKTSFLNLKLEVLTSQQVPRICLSLPLSAEIIGICSHAGFFL